LGGGISQETYSGYNYYWINPFEYESFGTMQFIRDLAKYYCVVALEKGADPSSASGSNRTINQELYEIQSSILADVHAWITKQGYLHTFLIGYSVGGQAAAMEVALRDPQGWSASDGLILITVPLISNVVDHAQNIKTNLLFLYGGNLPDFVVTGQKFYDNAPLEGWKGTYYFHKEFRILTDVGHEVWTVRDAGEYTPRALNLVVGFIERCKSLQFGPETNPPLSNSSLLELSSVNSPHKVATGSVFVIEGNVTYRSTSGITGGLMAYDEDNNETVSATVFDLTGEGELVIPLVMPPISSPSQRSYLIFPVLKSGDKWIRLEPQARIEITASDLITLTIKTGIPNATLIIDSSLHTLPPTGTGSFEVTRGTHSIQMMPLVMLGNNSRYVFTQWEDGSVSPQRQIGVDVDTSFTAFFRTQYLVTAITRYGVVLGPGWYDEQSTVGILVQPNIIESEQVIFARWMGDSSDSSPRTLLRVDSPKTLEVQWGAFRNEGSVGPSADLSWFLMSLIVFAVVLILNLRRPTKVRV